MPFSFGNLNKYNNFCKKTRVFSLCLNLEEDFKKSVWHKLAVCLEEKIGVIIDRKRNLMDDVIKEDSAELIKTFNREDLLVMLTPENF
ncbi:MAG: hypothetical protein U9N58_10515 [Thermodesulfobacteriota bacterium]|nr:hypothetical protein [Thermodesulfobacteriota bacterium]